MNTPLPGADGGLENVRLCLMEFMGVQDLSSLSRSRTHVIRCHLIRARLLGVASPCHSLRVVEHLAQLDQHIRDIYDKILV